ncbi:electron transfer flavoprotein subunit beta/FixA family protein [Haliscomenobacter sp.]|uniref:electron transfer flavoprotein subunit beta/FixA family protein n=1 Tax=Haliscomenobacter sp. TaxID=2717303 RepID=UPI003364C354
MKLLVCVSKTPDTTTKIVFNASNTELDTNGVQYIMNPYDEWYALVRALELKETLGGTVTLINVGSTENDQVIRKGLAIGADDAVRIDLNPQSALSVAYQIAEYARQESYDIVLLGKETIDYNGSEIGAMIAEYLDQPFISYASKLDIADGKTATIQREIEGGVEELEVEAPFVLSAAKGLAEQRIPNMKGIMMAKSKALKVVAPAAFEDQAVAVQYTLPPAKSSVKMIAPDHMEELVKLLHEEAKVI